MLKLLFSKKIILSDKNEWRESMNVDGGEYKEYDIGTFTLSKCILIFRYFFSQYTDDIEKI